MVVPRPFHVLLCTVSLSSVLAWDKDGHEAVGMTAMSALDTTAVSQVKRLMHGKDAVDVSAWAHKVNKKYPWTSEFHFQRQPSGRCFDKELMRKPPSISDCPDNRCLISGLKHFYGRLVNKQSVDIQWPSDMRLTDADAVKFLINLMGDLHQPMHFASARDDAGRNITVLFRGKTMSLYEMWDSYITQYVMQESPGFWWGGWTHVQRTRVEYEQDGAQWKKDGLKMLDKWAEETAAYLCNNIYRNALTGKYTIDEDPKKNFVILIDEDLFHTWKREMLSKILVAGARTAIVLNSILDHREAAKLQGGTAISHLEGEEDEEARSKVPRAGRLSDAHHHAGTNSRQGLSAAAINFGIFFCVLVVFLQIMRLWQGKDALAQADKAKRLDSGTSKKI